MSMMGDFKGFLNQGNVMGLAVGVIIGGAFGKIVSSLTDDVLMPLIGWITGGGVDFTNKFITLGDAGGRSFATLAEAKAAGVNVMALGSFITAIINFMILAFVVFMLVRQASKVLNMPSAGPSEVDLLTEIRDSLKK